jgi:hypothetical protein
MDPGDLEVLQRAARHLEHPSLAARLSSVIGTPVDIALKLLPKAWYARIHGVAENALHKSLRTAIDTFHIHEPVKASEGLYRVMAATTGAAGGFFGLPGLVVELPVTTTLMLRAVADIARSEGEDLQDPATQRACIEVFALGGRTESDDAADTGYYEVRLALAMYTASSASFVAQQGLAAEGAPILLRLANLVASRFGVAVSQKAAAQLVPVAGAAGAAAVNVIFISHFEDMARHHFAVRRLERKYGGELVQAAYQQYRDSAGR